MSRLNDEKRYPSKQNQNKRSIPKPARAWVFRPTKEQKEEVKAGYQDVQRCLRLIEAHLPPGNRLSCGYAQATDGIYLTIREATPNWEEARSVSVWHNDLDRCVQMLAYYLTEVNANFPERSAGIHDEEEKSW